MNLSGVEREELNEMVAERETPIMPLLVRTAQRDLVRTARRDPRNL